MCVFSAEKIAVPINALSHVKTAYPYYLMLKIAGLQAHTVTRCHCICFVSKVLDDIQCDRWDAVKVHWTV